ncbi:hypothetical protein CDAR_199861 [Caerostris darwini]|uniref:Uncharacterized protein n=1 Tax=Caerostris darwini TaxID=1538125 RepID=A0AAV4R016_9ARAC|nr:hypothetical protein CDAR_199861 [Caerostris darwini]
MPVESDLERRGSGNHGEIAQFLRDCDKSRNNGVTSPLLGATRRLKQRKRRATRARHLRKVLLTFRLRHPETGILASSFFFFFLHRCSPLSLSVDLLEVKKQLSHQSLSGRPK